MIKLSSEKFNTSISQTQNKRKPNSQRMFFSAKYFSIQNIIIQTYSHMPTYGQVLPEQIKHLSLLAGPVGLTEHQEALFGRSPN